MLNFDNKTKIKIKKNKYKKILKDKLISKKNNK